MKYQRNKSVKQQGSMTTVHNWMTFTYHVGKNPWKNWFSIPQNCEILVFVSDQFKKNYGCDREYKNNKISAGRGVSQKSAASTFFGQKKWQKSQIPTVS